MKKETIRRRQVFMLFAFVVLLGVLFFLNSKSGKSTNLPESFIAKESTTTSTNTKDTLQSEVATNDTDSISTTSTTETYESTYNGEQDIAAQFSNTYLQFSAKSISSVDSLIDPSLVTKLEQLKGEEQEIDDLSLLDRSTVEEQNIYVYSFKATLKNAKKTKKSGKIFVILTPPKKDKESSVVSDLEWAYET